MPFSNEGGQDMEYFVHGMTQEVITSLIKVDGLNVSSATSSFTLATDNSDPVTVGKRAGVEYVLVGNIRRSGNEVRMTTQLLNVSRKQYAWSNSYRGDVDDVFEVQTNISSDIARRLTDKLVLRGGQSLANQRPTSIAAYDLYLKGNFVADSDFSIEGLQKAIGYYNQALTIEPSYARAYSGIATAYYNLADDFWEPRKAYPRVRENAVRAIKLDPGLADAYASLASYEIAYGWNWKSAGEYAERAVALNPNNSFSRIMRGWYYLIRDRNDEAVSEARAAVVLDPFSVSIGASALSLMRAAGRHKLAVGEARRMLQEALGDSSQVRALMSWDYMLAGDLDSARTQLDSAIARSEYCCLRTEALYLAHVGKKEAARKKLQAWIEKKRSQDTYFRADWIAEVEAAIGDRDSMFEHLELAYQDRSVGIPIVQHNAELRPYKDDPRFTSLEKRLALF
jgi:TolB-like protein/Tfp pilus assembly protein PilF